MLSVDRCALFVDAGYVLADGAMAVHGTRRRESVSWDYAGLLQFLAGLAAQRSGLPLLRCYWYEATVEGRRGADHDALADLPGVKLRLAKMRPGRREGVESEIHRDLATLARNKAVSDAMVVSAEEDLASVIADVQDLGMRVTMLHITSDGNWTISRTLRQECDDIVEISASDLRPFVDLISGAEPSELPDALGAGERDSGREAVRSGANGHGLAGVQEFADAGVPGGGMADAGLAGPGLAGPGLAAAGLINSGGLVPVGLPAGGRPMPSFTPSSAGSNGYQAPYPDYADYHDAVAADYQRGGSQQSRGPRSGANGAAGGPASDGGVAGVGGFTGADDTAGGREEFAASSSAASAQAGPAQPGAAQAGLGRGEEGGWPDVPAAPPGRSPYDEPPRMAQDPAAMYQAPPQAAAMAPLAMPSGPPSRPEYAMPAGPFPGGRPDLPAVRQPQVSSAGQPFMYGDQSMAQGPMAQGPMGQGGQPGQPGLPGGPPQLPAGSPQAPAGPPDSQPRYDFSGPHDVPSGFGGPGLQGPADGPARPDLYPAPVAAPALPALPPAVPAPGSAGNGPLYEMPAARAFGSQDVSGYSPGATREPATQQLVAHEVIQGDQAGASPHGPAESAYRGGDPGTYGQGEPLPQPSGPGAQVHRFPPRGLAGGMPPAALAPAAGGPQAPSAQPGLPPSPQSQHMPAGLGASNGYGLGLPQAYSGPPPVPPGSPASGPQVFGLGGQPGQQFPAGGSSPAPGAGPGPVTDSSAAGGGPVPGATGLSPSLAGPVPGSGLVPASMGPGTNGLGPVNGLPPGAASTPGASRSCRPGLGHRRSGPRPGTELHRSACSVRSARVLAG